MGQLASAKNTRPVIAFPSDTKANPKASINVVSLRNERQLEEVPSKKRKQVAFNEKQATIEAESEKAKEPEKLVEEAVGQINIPLVDILQEVPKYAKYIKDIVANKRRLVEFETVALTEECSSRIQSKLSPKLKDLGSFTIQFSIGKHAVGRDLCDLGASINLMPIYVFRQLRLGEPRPTTTILQLADLPLAHRERVIEDVLVQVGSLIFPTDFIILDYEPDQEVQFILGHPFLATSRVIIDVCEGKMIMRVGDRVEGNYETLPVIISSRLTDVQEEKLLRVFREHKRAIGWTIVDIKGITPPFYMHKIFLEDGQRPSIEQERRLNPIIKEVVKKEVIKWLDAGIIFPISDSNWRCMMSIFTGMVEIFVEVFMVNFSVFGSSYGDCLKNLDKVLAHCEEINLVLNWKKCYFMVQEGIVLGHRVSKSGIEVDKVKVEAVAKLPPAISVKGVQSFLGHIGFYRRFIKDFSKIPLCKFLEKDVTFKFDEACLKAFEELKEKLMAAPIVVAPDWSLPFELMCDASDHAIGAVLGHRKDNKFYSIYYASKTLDDA
ncbi:uncharacterized protein [Nicotiana tomentosiformis]|uniref:uncharacterized protein n=1 Tax=Nicotiana tomentosiformis TaxID=4098 RepID=UPI00388CCA04